MIKIKKILKKLTPRMIKVQWQVWRGKVIDIGSNNGYPSNVLSNLCSNAFRFDGIDCRSMEGFLQGLKQQDKNKQRQICSMKGRKAKMQTTAKWQADQIVWWKGRPINRQGEEFKQLIRRAYQALFDQNERYREAVMATRGKKLMHTIGNNNPFQTILTEDELCSIITELRENYDRREIIVECSKKRVFVDMDNVLMNFQPELDRQSEETLKEYKGRLDEIPGIFANMQPVKDAIEAMHELQKHFDLYIISTAPLKNPSAWLDKIKWVTQYLDDVFHKRIVFTHCKNLCRGDYLIDCCDKNGTAEFEGEWIELGNEKLPDWAAVVGYLYKQNNINE